MIDDFYISVQVVVISLGSREPLLFEEGEERITRL